MENAREARWVAREARSLMGGNGITLEHIPVRHILSLESVYTYQGAKEIHQLILGKAVTGYDAFA